MTEQQHVFEGEPDARQQIEPPTVHNPFRPRYRALSGAEVQQHDDLKAAYYEVFRLINLLPQGRYRALALTSLEESCMWAIKELTN